MAVKIFGADADADGLNQTLLRKIPVHAAIADSQFTKEYIAGRLFCVKGHHERGFMGEQQRGKKSIQYHQHNDNCSNHGSSVFTETNPGVLKVTDGLVIKFPICKLFTAVGKSKFFLWDISICVYFLSHLFFPHSDSGIYEAVADIHQDAAQQSDKDVEHGVSHKYVKVPLTDGH